MQKNYILLQTFISSGHPNVCRTKNKSQSRVGHIGVTHKGKKANKRVEPRGGGWNFSVSGTLIWWHQVQWLRPLLTDQTS